MNIEDSNETQEENKFNRNFFFSFLRISSNSLIRLLNQFKIYEHIPEKLNLRFKIEENDYYHINKYL